MSVVTHQNPVVSSTNPAYRFETEERSKDFRVSEISLEIPSAPPMQPDYTANLINFRNKYEINPKYATMLQKITQYNSIVVADDSGSMNELADPDVGNSLTRWDELKKALEIIIEAHHVFHMSCDIYFINRGFVRNVSVFSQLQPFLKVPPQGGTNLLNVLNLIQTHHIGPDMGKPVIIHVLTDGHPTNSKGEEDILGIADWLRNRPQINKVFVSIVLCTDDEDIETAYRALEFNPRAVLALNRGILGVDVSEDYRGETRDVKRTRGRNYRFTFGDYLVKILVGTIDPTVHDIDLPDSLCAGCAIM